MNIVNYYDKIFIISCLTFAIYYTITCPCKIILSCHKYVFYLFLLIPILYIEIKLFVYSK